MRSSGTATCSHTWQRQSKAILVGRTMTCVTVIIVGWIVVIVLPALVSVARELAGWVDEEE